MAKTYAELFAEVRERVRTISLEALKARLDAGTPTTLVDVREQHEFNAGYIPGAIHIPRGFLEIQAEGKLPNKNAPIVVYCNGPECWKSFKASSVSIKAGYSNILWYREGFPDWKSKNMPIGTAE